MKLFILFLALFALSQAAPANETSHGLAHLSRQKRDEQAPVKSSSEIDKAAEAALPIDADKVLHQHEEVKKPSEHRHRREADHEEGHDGVKLVAKTLEGHDEVKQEPKTQESQVKTTGPTSAPKLKREAHHEEGHDDVKQEKKTPEETPVLGAVPAVAPSVAPVTNLKREANEPPPVKPASVIAAEQLAHDPHRKLEIATPLPANPPVLGVVPAVAPSAAPVTKPKREAHHEEGHHEEGHHEEGHHGDEEKAKKDEVHAPVEHRHQRDIPVPTEVKTTEAPTTTKAIDEASSTSAFPLRHRPKPVAELFHQSTTPKSTAAGSSSEESSE